jgi:hypothetical protein
MISSLGMFSFVFVLEDISGLQKVSSINEFMKSKELSFEIIGMVSESAELDRDELKFAMEKFDNTTILVSAAHSRDVLYSLGLEIALGDIVVEIPYMEHVDAVLDYLESNQFELFVEHVSRSFIGGGNFAIQLRPKKLGKKDVLLSWVATKTLDTKISTLSLYPRISSRSALSNWNSRRVRDKVVRLASQLNFISVSNIFREDIKPLKSDLRITTGLRTIVHSTPKPLRWVSSVSLMGSLISLIYSLYVVFLGTKSNTIRGWTTTNLQLSGISFLILLVIGLLSEYVFQIVASIISQPSYSIRAEYASKRFTYRIEKNLDLEKE